MWRLPPHRTISGQVSPLHRMLQTLAMRCMECRRLETWQTRSVFVVPLWMVPYAILVRTLLARQSDGLDCNDIARAAQSRCWIWSSSYTVLLHKQWSDELHSIDHPAISVGRKNERTQTKEISVLKGIASPLLPLLLTYCEHSSCPSKSWLLQSRSYTGRPWDSMCQIWHCFPLSMVTNDFLISSVYAQVGIYSTRKSSRPFCIYWFVGLYTSIWIDVSFMNRRTCFSARTRKEHGYCSILFDIWYSLFKR